MNENFSLMASYCKELGASLFGTASILDIRDGFDLPDELKHRFAWAVVIGQRLSSAVLDDLHDGPTPLYFHHYRQLNFFLDRAAFLVASRIQDLGYEALPVAASQVVDWERQRGHVSHKEIARSAGLGWIGRNNLLVNPQYGSQIRLASVLTTMPLDAAETHPYSCGVCRSCVNSCPANAIKDKPEDFDHIGCYEKLKEFRKKKLVSQFICGLCVKACPGRLKSPNRP